MLTKRNLVTTHATQEVSDHHPSHTHTHNHTKIYKQTNTQKTYTQTHTHVHYKTNTHTHTNIQHNHMDTNHKRTKRNIFVEVLTAVAVLNQDLGVSESCSQVLFLRSYLK